MRNHRIVFSLLALLALSCATPRAVQPVPESGPPEPHGTTLEEEATLLRLEDRREFDPAVAESWLNHSNSVHRARMALALGRIGPSGGQRMAIVDLLSRARNDPDFHVRRNVAFALGEIGDPAAIEPLFALSEDLEHADVAAEAVEGLSKMAASVPLDRYAGLTSAEIREGIRARAIRFLFRFGTDEASASAARYADDPNPDVRREAVYALARRAHAPARGRLELLLNDQDTLTRSYAARALGLIAAPASIPPLFRALQDAHPWVRTNSARSIGQIAEKQPGSISTPEIGEQVLRLIGLTRDPDPGTRAVAVETLGYYARHNEAARAHLLELAAGSSPWLRETAIGAVARHLGEGIDSPMHPLLATDARWVKIRALEGAAAHRISGPMVRERLFADADASVRAAAISAIPEGAVDAELGLLKRALVDSDPVVRANAIERYAAQKTDPADRQLETLRKSEERARNDAINDARLAAVTALGRTDWPERETFLLSLLQDRDPVVRRAAADLIEQQLKKPRPSYTPLAVERPLADYLEVARWAQSPHTATIHTSRGKIELMLLQGDAPMTAKNFADLAGRGFFNGTSFMRVVPNFVIQGGDPRNDMSGGPGYAIRDEINLQKYTRGAVGMALSGPDTGGSQFFITHSPQPHLDGGYTIFARVIGGMTGVVDQTERGDTIEKITIDENKPGQAPDHAAIERTPLPTEIGRIAPSRLLSVVPEYGSRKNEYRPDPAVVEMMSTAIQPGDRMEVYLGTWCLDSQREVPKFLKTLDLLKRDYGVELPVSFVALNRAKQEPADLITGKNIDKVSTFIYYRGDAEMGRIVEKPTGLFEDDLLQIIARPR